MSNLVEAQDLRISYKTRHGVIYALDGADFILGQGQIVGLVGESGSGKTTLGMAIGRLLPSNSCRETGDLLFDGKSVFKRNDQEIRSLRQERLGFIFQNPMSALDPTMRVRRQIQLSLKEHASDDLVYKLLRKTGLQNVERVARSYPHQLSGGMAQRVVIAIAISKQPSLLIADEPTASLDASIREQILKLLLSIRDETGASMVLLSHELRLVARYCDNISVMYAGRVVETGPGKTVFKQPAHPYTKALLRAAPGNEKQGDWLKAIPGVPPVLHEVSIGCAFAPRCQWADSKCLVERPGLRTIRDRFVACHYAEELHNHEPSEITI